MPALTITVTQVARLAHLDATTDAAEISAAIFDYQLAFEQTIDAAELVYAGNSALMVLNIGKLIAAEVLAARAREEGGSGTIVAGGVTVSSVPDHAVQLRKEADFQLLAYLRRRNSPAGTPTSESPASLGNQERLFGKTESARRGTPYDNERF